MKLDLGITEYFPTNQVEGFDDALEKLIPTLYSHRCSVGTEGGFFKRVREGTWMGHVIEHIALELQTLADMDCGFGRTRSSEERGVYFVVFAYEIESAGVYAGKAAVRIVKALLNKEFYDLEPDINELRRIQRRKGLGPSTLSIVKEAESRGIPCTRLDHNSLIMLGYGKNQKIMDATISGTTSSVGTDLASDKETTRQLLSKMYVPFPEGILVETITELNEAVEELGFPLVIKPNNGNHGRGITININSHEEAAIAFRKALEISDEIVIEKCIKGNDYRLLVINYKLAAAAKRTPAMIIGDGILTIKQLMDEANSDLRRGDGHEKVMTKIRIDDEAMEILNANNMNLDHILSKGEILFLKRTANISSGGTATDVTDKVHPDNVLLAERIARIMGLNICGLDVISEDISVPLAKNNGALLEVNAAPGFRMHLAPASGEPRNVAKNVIDMLFPDNAPSRIPIVAVTGTNGKTTVTRLIAHIAKSSGYNTGYTTTDGIYINGEPINYGDCSGPESSAVVLRDPAIEFAVLECARGGILRSGLGFDKCDVGIVTNVTSDHLGLKDIHTLEDLAKVKAVVPQSTFDDGYAILNADDDLVYNMKKPLDCNVALFSMDSQNPRIKDHCDNGGLAAVVKNGNFVICKGKTQKIVAGITEVPLTFSGTSECGIINILPAILTAEISNFSAEQINLSLRTFMPSPQLTPGRMNLFTFNNFKLLIDYAHNEAAFMELKKYVDKVVASKKVGIISGTGDRRDEDIRKAGYYSAQMYDEIIINHDRDSRGRTNEEITKLLIEGIEQVSSDLPVKIISDELTAIEHAINDAGANSFIVVCADDVYAVIDFVSEAQKSEIRKAEQVLVEK